MEEKVRSSQIAAQLDCASVRILAFKTVPWLSHAALVLPLILKIDVLISLDLLLQAGLRHNRKHVGCIGNNVKKTFLILFWSGWLLGFGFGFGSRFFAILTQKDKYEILSCRCLWKRIKRDRERNVKFDSTEGRYIHVASRWHRRARTVRTRRRVRQARERGKAEERADGIPRSPLLKECPSFARGTDALQTNIHFPVFAWDN